MQREGNNADPRNSDVRTANHAALEFITMTTRFFRKPTLIAAAIGAALGAFGSLEVAPGAAGAPLKLSMAVPSAEAHPAGVARRTARRVTRRHAAAGTYRASVAGCAYVRPYYRCGAIYYRPVVEGGKTVYVSVDQSVTVAAPPVAVEKNVTISRSVTAY